MLPTYLKNKPPPKCVLIQDSVKVKGNNFLKHIINNHKKFNGVVKQLYLEFEYNRSLNDDGLLKNVEKHDFIQECENQRTADDQIKEILSLINQESCIVIIDSMAHMIINFGKDKTYSLVHKLKQSNKVVQVVSILHMDMFNENDGIFKYFNHLSTLSMKLSPMFMSEWPRVNYTYKKVAGKIIEENEQFSFVNGELVTKAIEKLDPKTLVQTAPAVIPEALTTFKISLNESDKKLRDNFTLPYLPKDETVKQEGGGLIHYEFDDIDDWDEEDPDDDLDI
ncbi:PREDICTED: elongator complex protein 5 [Nicrophorus vespilloides]|uniref:Elongator complex protein 5 n=1 Tax=Nicrophorus vespilloides TaxID=110193 RepID=A0ABM1NIT7_NICVS|nr:PREDICTED: elongator complex protein 5 [Nicrophorus vespilloides]